jgi:motility quorum-sensing regulator/GCU-specific mRNA interferase toxin
MEKGIPHYPLDSIKALIHAGRIRTTVTAQRDARKLGINRLEMFQEVLKIERDEFYKSMTTYFDHAIWQDVYRHQSDYGQLYIKLTVIDDVLIVPFKDV